jgi:peptide/nickel transport system substrate-binding protein
MTVRVLACVFLSVYLLSSSAVAQSPTHGGSLVVQVSAEPPGLDLTASPASAIAGIIHQNVQEGLLRIDRAGRLAPSLAERWNISPDGLTYTFYLKCGVRFHDGREFRADDVKFVLERARNPETNHPHQEHYATIASIRAKNDLTLVITLTRPTGSFLLALARQGSVIYPREAARHLKSKPVGTGPFRFKDWVRGDRIVLEKNPAYHVQGLPYLDRITFRVLPDPNAALAALKAGDVDMIPFGLPPEAVAELKQSPRFQVTEGHTTIDVILAMNNSRPPFNHLLVRRALTHAIDKAEVIQGAMFGFGRAIGSHMDPLNPYYVDLSKEVPYDREKARQLLSQAGYPTGFEATLKVPPAYAYAVRAGEVIAGQLGRVGVRVKIEQIEWGQWLDRVYTRADYDLTIIGHAEAWDIANYAKPTYYLRYDSPRFQKVYGEAESTTDEGKRRERYIELQRILLEEAPAVFLFNHPRLAAAKKGIFGLWRDLPTVAGELVEVWRAR